MADEVAPTLPHVAVCRADKAETRLMQEVLKEGGYPASLIQKPETVIPHLLRTKADILILNSPFGNMDKHAMMRAIRSHPRLTDMVVLALVPEEEATDADIAQAWQAGVDVYAKKPIVKEELAAFMVVMTRSVRGENIRR